MCGIVGALSWGNFPITEQYIETMRDTMEHRGPDGFGHWISPEKNLGLGHRRLSIIDLSAAANQPMSTLDGDLWLVFNGEIYNHAEIRNELKALGYFHWKTDHSDTETILYAFRAWGIECLHKFRGMFAFALWDNTQKELWLVRDRIGIKPLYYSIHNNRIVFASEIKALLKDPQQARALNEDALFHYLSFLVSPAPETLFSGIYKLAPGSWLKVNHQGKIIERKYWEVWEHVKPLVNETEEQIAELLLSELRTAVKLRKISDVPVGVFLSGGIDSSTNAALFSEGESNKVKTFTIGYQGENKAYKNEDAFARLMSKKVDSIHYEKFLTVEDLLDFLPKMVKLQDEPLADPVCIPVYYVSKMARDNGITVAQVGEGSDELFWGYQTWKIMYNLQRYSNVPGLYPIKKLALKLFNLFGKEDGLKYEFLRRSSENQPVFWSGSEAFTQNQKIKLLAPRLKKRFIRRTSWEVIEPVWNRFQNKAWEKSILHWMSYQDLNLRLPELLLMRVDKMSMGVSLEGRVPFLDHKFVEMALAIPSKIKTHNQQLKYILKKTVRGVIPDELIDRPKQGFGVPISDYFITKLGTIIENELKAFCNQTDILDYNAVSSHFNTNKIWTLFNFALWWKEYVAA
ncbi:MAG: asparagine synthase (glutamine-hydrolyzing) [Proteobacteria bacterium]|nr:asparagine synthase (glutamine-hydrolyzing) [Pseudomonadota bacterium]